MFSSVYSPLKKPRCDAQLSEPIGDKNRFSYKLDTEWRRLAFASLREFQAWRSREEHATTESFIGKSRKSQKKDLILHYYCARSVKALMVDGRPVKISKAEKTLRPCSARIQVKIFNNGMVRGKYYLRHSHEIQRLLKCRVFLKDVLLRRLITKSDEPCDSDRDSDGGRDSDVEIIVGSNINVKTEECDSDDGEVAIDSEVTLDVPQINELELCKERLIAQTLKLLETLKSLEEVKISEYIISKIEPALRAVRDDPALNLENPEIATQRNTDTTPILRTILFSSVKHDHNYAKDFTKLFS